MPLDFSYSNMFSRSYDISRIAFSQKSDEDEDEERREEKN